MAQAYKVQVKEKKIWGKITPNREKLKQTQNAFYCIMHKAKRVYQQNFLKGMKKSLDIAQIWPENKNRY